MIFAAAGTWARSCCELQRASCEERMLVSTLHFVFGSKSNYRTWRVVLDATCQALSFPHARTQTADATPS